MDFFFVFFFLQHYERRRELKQREHGERSDDNDSTISNDDQLKDFKIRPSIPHNPYINAGQLCFPKNDCFGCLYHQIYLYTRHCSYYIDLTIS